ncbi:TPA: hypothetical protein I9776_001936 [Klebsiella oxytoca]|uniref:hypothetical protein n=1 Tax=Enterobacteriaceae TaxID=543 RepID=UPI0006664929|nr:MULTISPECIES: hypothetical protein [Enterobacter]HAT2195229.1 hypothetical protein [Citrobacter freundii]HAT5062277.1 hypothetical protein [Klebsiella oxytoca]CZZ71324.1 Uncharacterised protein [Enterobacter hormaechei]HAT2563642.1 hypothetical protein [Citrobacter freundii]HAT5069233.1 hypothetical protein [Klebsiella oxytoca]
MAVYEIKTINHWNPVITVFTSGNEQDAIASMKEQMERMGYSGVEAAATRRMNESYGNGGYGLIAVEDFQPVM